MSNFSEMVVFTHCEVHTKGTNVKIYKHANSIC